MEEEKDLSMELKEDCGNDSLTIHDMTLLMNIYKENMEVLSPIAENQKRSIEQINNLLLQQKEIYEEISNITCVFRDFTIQMLQKEEELKTQMAKEHSELKIDITKESSSVNNVLYGTVITLIGFVIAVITGIELLNTKLAALDKLETLDKIATLFGLK